MRPLRIAFVLSTLVVAGTVTACVANSDASPPDPTGRTFVSTAVDGDPIPGGGPLTLTFGDDGRLAADAGCNRGSAPVDFSEGRLATRPFAMTMMACQGERADADHWLTALFDAQPSWSLTGDTLTLTAPGTAVHLAEPPPEPDRSVTGTRWIVTALTSPDAVTRSVALETSPPEITVSTDGTVTGSTGCHRLRADAEIGDTGMVVGDAITTDEPCPPELAELERAVLDALAGHVTVTVEGTSAHWVNDRGLGFELRAWPL
ncbi:META domain-containing protein [Rhodococcus rhodnii]|uniref:DUF306 domain-containing protein n=2 Tax=Rhodococcus rhodnii TaxID=38312 RepID=R7WLT6_9NOCA|nr:META domain-containing protein [Rhodococcus rhodnii]EOM76258.1 hypothetical protein Rrhod_2358 [Rhodococcus rhodnii LMG 5362]TXG90737.1 META domain-containing protein [Rhodococcus rhodnii]